MEEIKGIKKDARGEVLRKIDSISEVLHLKKERDVCNRLFEFANFMEAKVVLLYFSRKGEVNSKKIIEKALESGKIVVIPVVNSDKFNIHLMKITDPLKDMIINEDNIPQPDINKCKKVPIKSIDIAVIPGLVFDEKGGRIGVGDGYYDKLIPKLPATTRAVALALEEQILPQVPMDTHDKYVDIIITGKRIIYKI